MSHLAAVFTVKTKHSDILGYTHQAKGQRVLYEDRTGLCLGAGLLLWHPLPYPPPDLSGRLLVNEPSWPRRCSGGVELELYRSIDGGITLADEPAPVTHFTPDEIAAFTQELSAMIPALLTVNGVNHNEAAVETSTPAPTVAPLGDMVSRADFDALLARIDRFNAGSPHRI